MVRRSRQSAWARSMQRAIGAMTRTSLDIGMRAGTRALKQATAATLKQTKAATARTRKPAAKGAAGGLRADGLLRDKGSRSGLVDCVPGLAIAAAGARRYHLFKPPGMKLSERLPLVVMLHGCGQDAGGFALGTRMNRIAARERFLVLYPEQDRLANPQLCWNWHEIRSRRAYGEASIIRAAIDQACLLYPVDPQRIGIAGLSAGASMAALLATRYPDRFKAVAMHSGVPPGAADSTASALRAMRGRTWAPAPAAAGADTGWPPLLVIHGSLDRVVSATNAEAAARLWAAAAGTGVETVRRVQRGARYPMTVTDFGSRGRLAATWCEVEGLGHAWSGGPASERFSDPSGPDASRLVWAFMSRRFRAGG